MRQYLNFPLQPKKQPTINAMVTPISKGKKIQNYEFNNINYGFLILKQKFFIDFLIVGEGGECINTQTTYCETSKKLEVVYLVCMSYSQ